MELKIDGKSVTPFRFMVWTTRPHLKWAISAIVMMAIGITLERITAYLVKILIDVANAIDSDNPNFTELWFWVFAYPGVYLLTGIARRSCAFLGMRWITGASATVYKSLFNYLTGHSSSYFGTRTVGSLSRKIANVADGTERIMRDTLWGYLPIIFSVIANAFLTYLVHPLMFFAYTGWVVCFFSLNFFYIWKFHSFAVTQAQSLSELSGRVVDTISNIESVQHTDVADYEQNYIANFIEKWRVAHLKSLQVNEYLLVFNNVLITIAWFGLVVVGAYLLEGQAITLGSFVMVLTIVMGLHDAMFHLGIALGSSLDSFGQVSDGLSEILVPHEIVDPPMPSSLSISCATIEFREVCFSYDSKQVFDHLNFTLVGGKKVGLVGLSGAGKSTIVKLLLRQYEAHSGKILIDNQAINSVKLSDLRKSFAVVPQSCPLFHRTIGENIRLGKLDATQEDIEDAAQTAEIHDVIMSLPFGYDTMVGERGVKLSGGQRQRIAIARAILSDAPILILDEATSSLDTQSEIDIQRGLSRLMTGRTVLAIAHRLSTLREMDHILVLNKGRIFEQGTHDELLRNQGLYASLWKNQIEGFIVESSV